MEGTRERKEGKSVVARSILRSSLLLVVLTTVLLVSSCAATVQEGRYDAYRARVTKLREALSTKTDEIKVEDDHDVLELNRLMVVNDLIAWLDLGGLMSYVVPDGETFEELEQALAQLEQVMGIKPVLPRSLRDQRAIDRSDSGIREPTPQSRTR